MWSEFEDRYVEFIDVHDIPKENGERDLEEVQIEKSDDDEVPDEQERVLGLVNVDVLVDLLVVPSPEGCLRL